MLTDLPRSETLPAAARALVGASLRLLVQADEAVVRAAATRDRLRASSASVPALLGLPAPRRGIDEL